MAKAGRNTTYRRRGTGAGKVAERYTHPEQTSAMRPDVGTQAQFRKKKPPKTYRYDSSLSPALEWDGQNGARDLGERLKDRPDVHLIVETKGFDPVADIKNAAAERWVAAVNADGTYGSWLFAMARSVPQVRDVLDQVS